MRSTNRKRSLMISSAIILLCMTVVVGSTWALFTDTNTVSNHLIAGDLDIKLERTDLVKTTLDEKGFLSEITVQDSAKQPTPDAPVDFSNANDQNVFALGTDEKVVPGSKFVATMKMTNNSDVAFGYWIKIVCTDENTGKDSTAILADQLRVVVYTDKNDDGVINTNIPYDTNPDASYSTIANGLTVGADDDFINVLGIGDYENFIVSVEFVDEDYELDADGVLTSENDAAMKDEVKFDLIVYAIQETTNPETTTP